MSDIRPAIWPAVQPPANRPQRPAAEGGRAAFFQAALSQAGVSQAGAPAVVQEAAPAGGGYAARPAPAVLPEEPPKKILRPGSILDIKV
ncbi:MAG: hypothetical protein ACK4RV_14700 [Caulobacter sp.]